jgi:hypothetical protein
MLPVTVKNDEILVGERFAVAFHRTLRIPDDGRTYPLPPGLGRFPICRVEDYAGRVPPEWRARGGVFIPLYQREALWLGFEAAPWKPNAVQVGVGGINAVSGTPWGEGLSARPQNYLVCPDQPWLDGINAGDGHVRQFVAMPLGRGYTVEGQLTGREEFGGIQILVYEPRPGRFPDQPPPEPAPGPVAESLPAPPAAMGLGAGGQMSQKVYPDPYGLDVWDPDNRGRVTVHLLNSEQYRALTGRGPPPSPVTARTYSRYGLPWFDLADQGRGDLPPSQRLAGVRPVGEVDSGRGTPGQPGDAPVDIDPGQVKRIEPPPGSA